MLVVVFGNGVGVVIVCALVVVYSGLRAPRAW